MTEPKIITTIEQLKQLHEETVLLDQSGAIVQLNAFYNERDEIAPNSHMYLPAIVLIEPGDKQVETARLQLTKATVQINKMFIVQYPEALFGAHENYYDTREEALEEAAYDHYMNGKQVRVLDHTGTIIAKFEKGEQQ